MSERRKMTIEKVLVFAYCFLAMCLVGNDVSIASLREDLHAIIQCVQIGNPISHAKISSVNKRVSTVTNELERSKLLYSFETQLFAIDPQCKDFKSQEIIIENVRNVARGVFGSPPGGTEKEWWAMCLKALAWEKTQLERIEKSKPEDCRSWTEKWQSPEPLSDKKYMQWRELMESVKSDFYKMHLRRCVYDAENDRYTSEFRAWCLQEIEKIIGRPLTDDDIMFKEDVLKRRKARDRAKEDVVK